MNLSTSRKLLIIALCYFAEGFPYAILKDTVRIHFSISGMSVEHVGYLSALSLPFALKFLWAPAVDFLGTRRRWIASAQLCMAVVVLFLLTLDPSHPGVWLWSGLATLAILSATQDIAIDAYSIELLKLSEIGIANGVRLAAYRVALVVAGSFLVILGGRYGWELVYILASAVLFILGAVSLRLPRVEVKRTAASLASVMEPVRDFMARPGLVYVILFIVLYKAGDMAMAPMIIPFWVQRLSTDGIGLAGTIGIVASVLGGLGGGVMISRFGIFHALWFFGTLQAGGNLVYAWVAAVPESGPEGVYLAQAVDSVLGGAGTAAFLAFLMGICKKEYSATQYALLSSLFQVPAIFLGVVSGELAAELGFPRFFALTFFMGLPALAFVFRARTWIRPGNGVDGQTTCHSSPGAAPAQAR